MPGKIDDALNAIKKGEFETVRKLLAEDDNIINEQGTPKDHTKNTLLIQLAYAYGNAQGNDKKPLFELIQIIIQKQNLNVRETNGFGDNVLHLWCRSLQYDPHKAVSLVPIIKELLEKLSVQDRQQLLAMKNMNGESVLDNYESARKKIKEQIQNQNEVNARTGLLQKITSDLEPLIEPCRKELAEQPLITDEPPINSSSNSSSSSSISSQNSSNSSNNSSSPSSASLVSNSISSSSSSLLEQDKKIEVDQTNVNIDSALMAIKNGDIKSVRAFIKKYPRSVNALGTITRNGQPFKTTLLNQAIFYLKEATTAVREQELIALISDIRKTPGFDAGIGDEYGNIGLHGLCWGFANNRPHKAILYLDSIQMLLTPLLKTDSVLTKDLVKVKMEQLLVEKLNTRKESFKDNWKQTIGYITSVAIREHVKAHINKMLEPYQYLEPGAPKEKINLKSRLAEIVEDEIINEPLEEPYMLPSSGTTLSKTTWDGSPTKHPITADPYNPNELIPDERAQELIDIYNSADEDTDTALYNKLIPFVEKCKKDQQKKPSNTVQKAIDLVKDYEKQQQSSSSNSTSSSTVSLSNIKVDDRRLSLEQAADLAVQLGKIILKHENIQRSKKQAGTVDTLIVDAKLSYCNTLKIMAAPDALRNPEERERFITLLNDIQNDESVTKSGFMRTKTTFAGMLDELIDAIHRSEQIFEYGNKNKKDLSNSTRSSSNSNTHSNSSSSRLSNLSFFNSSPSLSSDVSPSSMSSPSIYSSNNLSSSSLSSSTSSTNNTNLPPLKDTLVEIIKKFQKSREQTWNQYTGGPEEEVATHKAEFCRELAEFIGKLNTLDDEHSMTALLEHITKLKQQYASGAFLEEVVPDQVELIRNLKKQIDPQAEILKPFLGDDIVEMLDQLIESIKKARAAASLLQPLGEEAVDGEQLKMDLLAIIEDQQKQASENQSSPEPIVEICKKLSAEISSFDLAKSQDRETLVKRILPHITQGSEKDSAQLFVYFKIIAAIHKAENSDSINTLPKFVRNSVPVSSLSSNSQTDTVNRKSINESLLNTYNSSSSSSSSDIRLVTLGVLNSSSSLSSGVSSSLSLKENLLGIIEQQKKNEQDKRKYIPQEHTRKGFNVDLKVNACEKLVSKINTIDLSSESGRKALSELINNQKKQFDDSTNGSLRPNKDFLDMLDQLTQAITENPSVTITTTSYSSI